MVSRLETFWIFQLNCSVWLKAARTVETSPLKNGSRPPQSATPSQHDHLLRGGSAARPPPAFPVLAPPQSLLLLVNLPSARKKVAGLLFPLLLEELQFYLNTPCRSLMYLIESLRISDLLSFLSSGCVGSSLRNSAKAPLTCCWRNRSLIGCGYLQLARVVESDRFTCGYSSSFELRGGEVRPVR